MIESKSRDKITSTLGSINGTNRQVRPVKIVEEEFQLMHKPVQYSKNIFNGFDDSRLEQYGITVFLNKLNWILYSTKAKLTDGLQFLEISNQW